MEKDNKWGMFRNFMYNELGISKEDIRTWIKEAVHEEARKMISNTFDKCDIEHMIKDMLVKELNKRNGYNLFAEKLVYEIVKKLEIKLKE